MIGKTGAKLRHRPHALGQDQWRAGFQPVDAGVYGNRGGLEAFVDGRDVKGNLDDRKRE